MIHSTRSILPIFCIALGVAVAVSIALCSSLPSKVIVAEPPASPIQTPPPAQLAPYAPPVTQQVHVAPVESPQKSEAEPAESSRLISELIQVVRMQAEKKEAAEPPLPAPASVAAEVAPEAKRIEQLPAPEAANPAAPHIHRGEGDNRLRISLQESDLRNVLELLSQQGDLNILASKSVSGTVTATMVDVSVEAALDAILKSTGFIARREGNFIYVGTTEDFNLQDKSLDEITTRVYRPNYVSAADLTVLITPLLSADIGKITVSLPAKMDIPASQVSAGGNTMTQSDVVVVRDYERVLLQIDQLLREIDLRPRQVMIDATVISVKLSDQTKLGVDFQLLKNKNNVKFGLGSPPATLAGVNFNEGGLKFAFLDSDLTALVSALETVGETNVIASPRLLCLNKQKAEIQIGEQLGYVSTTVTETSSTQSIQFLDVGTLLRIRPYISSDGTIRLDIHPELSTGSVTVSSGLTLPNKEVTQVTTNVMCNNGSTVVIGGLIREDLSNDTTQVPFLGSIPIAGALFRKTTSKVERREILVLITPRLIEDPYLSEEGTRIGNEFLRRQEVSFDKMTNLSKLQQAERYYRLAKAAWAANDGENALKYANLSIHFNPMDRQVIAFRDMIVPSVAPDESINQYLNQGLPLWKHPHFDHSRQGAPWKKEPYLHINHAPPDTWSPGEPGRSLSLPAPPPPTSNTFIPETQRIR